MVEKNITVTALWAAAELHVHTVRRIIYIGTYVASRVVQIMLKKMYVLI